MDVANASSKFSNNTAISIVVANMIGTGVFTSLGFQLLEIQSAPIILLLWTIGGILALCGALCYAELSSCLPRSGGEYNFVSKIYHPGAGFVSGWVSATIGFAAPTALAAITCGTYLAAVFPALNVSYVAIGLVLLVGGVHLGSRRGSAGFQLTFTSIKIVLILLFIASAWWYVEALQTVRWLPQFSDVSLLTSGGFAIALIYVNYAYTGWNAATYLADEVADPQINIPRILLTGTVVVMVLYLLLHIMFLTVAPMSAIAGQLEVGYVVAQFAFGEMGSKWVAGMLALLLVSTVSAMVLAGPRALQVIGQDFRMLRWLGIENQHGVPVMAIAFQTTVTVFLVVTSTFQSILVFSSFTLALNTLVTVFGVVLLRRQRPLAGRAKSFTVPWYPWPVIIFIAIMSWTLVYVLWQQPVEGVFGITLIVVGWLFYVFSRDRVEA
ncbi:MAG: amino acid permease [Gammaproteobacteria bacterium]|nr:amino acid permease [Gammaproteobacteria bacterium]